MPPSKRRYLNALISSPPPISDHFTADNQFLQQSPLAQYVGRLHRQRIGKTNVLVVDHVDGAVPVFGRMAARRWAGYRGLGY